MDHFGPLKRRCQKSLPASLFQWEKSFSAIKGEFLLLLPLLERGSCEKIEWRDEMAFLGHPQVPQFPAASILSRLRRDERGFYGFSES
jgi:hypothetical protein